MLVLSRKVGQELIIGNNIRIVINRVAGNRVTVAIEAPDEVPILRGELQEIRGDFGHVDYTPPVGRRTLNVVAHGAGR
jgi:carbon storage regulator CsrA